MRHAHRVFSAALIVAGALVSSAHAQTVRTDSRWLPWIGCWSPDSTFGAPSSSATTCFVPVKGSSSVDAITVEHGKVGSRDRLDATGRPHQMSVQGCDGSETANWSESERRVFLRSDYACAGGVKGSSSTIYAFLPTGEWLRAQDVRSGGGSIASADHMRPVVTSLVSTNIKTLLASVDDERLTATTARARAAAPITVDEVVEAYRAVGPDVTHAWLVEANQRFTLDGPAAQELAHADLPPSIVQAVMGANLRGQTVADTYTPPALSNGEYFNVPGYGGMGAAPQTVNVYTTSPYSAYDGVGMTYPNYYGYPIVYAAPLIRHVEHREPVRPVPRPRPIGIRP